MEFRDRLKAARKHAKLTQKQLGEAVGMTQQSYQGLESGLTASSSYTTAIAVRCGVSPEWLALGTGEMVPAPPSQHAGFELEKILDAQRLLRRLHQITRDPADSEENIASLVVAYQVVDAESREPHRADAVDLVQRLADKLRAEREKADGDKRRETQGTGGKDGRGTAKRAR